MNSTSGRNNVVAVIPFYNEEKTIEEVISKTLKYVDNIICVDDGSTDNSLSRINRNKIIILKNDVNRGKGYSLKRGFQKSIELKTDYTISLDADLQHPPEFIPAFLNTLNNFDMVIGNRLTDLTNMPLQRILSNKFTSGLLSFKTGKKILDSQCGFRGFRTKILNSILPSYTGFESESEMIVKAAKHNFEIGFINIPTIYGTGESKMRPLQTIKGFIKVFLS